MKVIVKCPKCGNIITMTGTSENIKCPNCAIDLKIDYEGLLAQRSKIKKITILLNIPVLILGFVAFIIGVKAGYIAAGILLYQLIWVTVYRYQTMKKLKS